MAGKYGKRNTVSRNITDYSLCLLGESGVGKTTTIYETCEKLVGENGYLLLNMGKEDGISCIDGIIYENVESWKKFDDVTKDIVKNKSTDYPDLKIVVIDTIDQLFDMAEPEIVRRYNQEKMGEKGFKPVKTINAAYGGFGAGLTECERLVLNKLWELKSAGVTVWMCGHVKAKEIVDPITDQTYNTLSALLSQRYFNAIKTKMHIVGMAVIDRNVVTESTGRKNIVTKEDITKNKIVSEARKIIFRDDNYGVDSKSRFKYIVDEIPLDSDCLIKAIQDAIDKAAGTDEKKPDPVVQQKSEEAKVQVEEDDSTPFPMNEPVEEDEEDAALTEDLQLDDLYADLSNEELAAEATRKFKESKDVGVKEAIRAIIKPFGRMSNVDREHLLEILNLF